MENIKYWVVTSFRRAVPIEQYDNESETMGQDIAQFCTEVVWVTLNPAMETAGSEPGRVNSEATFDKNAKNNYYQFKANPGIVF